MSTPASPIFRQSALLGNPHANHSRSFHRFLDLPRELRDQVYLEAARDIHDVALPDQLSESRTRDVALFDVCPQIRAEAEEYILSECILVAILRTKFSCKPNPLLIGVSLAPATETYLDSLSDVQFSRIKRLRFWCEVSFNRGSPPYLDFAAYIDLTRARYGLLLFRTGQFFGSPDEHTVESHMSALRTLLAEICARKTGRFERSDVGKIVEAIGDQAHNPQKPRRSAGPGGWSGPLMIEG